MATVTGYTKEKIDSVFAPITGTQSALAASNPIPAPGQLIYATDSKKFAFGDGVTHWLDLLELSVTELDFAESAVIQSGISTTPVDITGLTVDFTVTTGKPVYVRASLPILYNTAASVTLVVAITDLAGVVKRSAAASLAASSFTNVDVFERIAVPGTYSRKVQTYKTLGAGTYANGNAATDVSSLVATRMSI